MNEKYNPDNLVTVTKYNFSTVWKYRSVPPFQRTRKLTTRRWTLVSD
jgi:hypothetical protein